METLSPSHFNPDRLFYNLFKIYLMLFAAWRFFLNAFSGISTVSLLAPADSAVARPWLTARLCRVVSEFPIEWCTIVVLRPRRKSPFLSLAFVSRSLVCQVRQVNWWTTINLRNVSPFPHPFDISPFPPFAHSVVTDGIVPFRPRKNRFSVRS